MGLRIPFLKFHATALPRAKMLARILKVPTYAGYGLCVALWEWAINIAPEHNGEVDLSGDIYDKDPATFIAIGIGYEGNAKKLYDAFGRCGFLTLHTKGTLAHINGLPNYEEVITTKKQRSEQAKRAADARWANYAKQGETRCSSDAQPMLTHAQAMLVDAKMEKEMEMETDARNLRAGTSSFPQGSPQRQLNPQNVVPPEPGPWGKQFCEVYLAVTGARYRWTAADERYIGDLQAADAPFEEGLAKWRVALKASENRFQSPKVHTLADLVKHWNAFPVAAAAPPPLPTSPLVSEYAARLTMLREAGHVYAALQLRELVPEELDGEVLRVRAPDPSLHNWVFDHYWKLGAADSIAASVKLELLPVKR
ncbi:MAG: hypothetical protein KA310_03335 [Pseudomonadales bacterium]|nr:hypothetical protein [Pseudomonadales bacterium]